MALSSRQRWIVLGSALALTLGLAAWLGNPPEEPPPAPAAGEKAPGPVQSGRVGQVGGPNAGGPISGNGAAVGQAGEIADIFAPQSWRPAPQAQGAAPGAAGPTRPPFTYFGKLIEGHRVTVYLADAERNLAVRQGDVIDGTWRIESIGRKAIVLRNLATGTQQMLEIGRAQ